MHGIFLVIAVLSFSAAASVLRPTGNVTTSLDCYAGNGTVYNGSVAVDEHGNPCLNWMSPELKQLPWPDLNTYKEILMSIIEVDGTANHSYCRIAKKDIPLPWCAVSDHRGLVEVGICNVHYCSDVTPDPRTDPDKLREALYVLLPGIGMQLVAYLILALANSSPGGFEGNVPLVLLGLFLIVGSFGLVIYGGATLIIALSN